MKMKYLLILIIIFACTIILLIDFQVQNKVKIADISWNRAMDEVRADRLTEKHGKNALLVIIYEWPRTEKYKDKPELIPSLEYLVRM